MARRSHLHENKRDWHLPAKAAGVESRAPSGGSSDSLEDRLAGMKALMLAILEDAIRAYLGPVPRPQEEAAQWMADTASRWVFSFPVVCDTLGLQPSAVRTAVQLMQARNSAYRVGRSHPYSRHRLDAGEARAGLPNSWAVGRRPRMARAEESW